MKKRFFNGKMIAVVIILCMFVISIGAFLVKSKYVFHASLDGITVDRYEYSAELIEDGEDDFKDKELSETDGEFRIHINHLPDYDSVSQTYNLQIWNASNNSYLMRVVITQENTTILRTNLIRTGYKMDDVQLTGATEGSALATFTAYDKETLEEIGSAEVMLTLPMAN